MSVARDQFQEWATKTLWVSALILTWLVLVAFGLFAFVATVIYPFVGWNSSGGVSMLWLLGIPISIVAEVAMVRFALWVWEDKVDSY